MMMHVQVQNVPLLVLSKLITRTEPYTPVQVVYIIHYMHDLTGRLLSGRAIVVTKSDSLMSYEDVLYNSSISV